MANVFEIKDLSFSYHKQQVLTDVSFVISESAVNVFLGANGAGKTTLIKILSGIYKYKSGSVFMGGREIKTIRPQEYARYVSYVPQDPVFESQTVIDALLLGRLPYFSAPSKSDYEKVYSVIERSGLEKIAMKDVTKLSGGEKQKVALARCLVSDADIIILDEPTANLDIKNRYEIIKLLKELSQSGKTVIVSIHDVNDALDVGDRFVLMKEGRVVECVDKEALSPDVLSHIYGLEFYKVEHNGKIHFHFKEE